MVAIPAHELAELLDWLRFARNAQSAIEALVLVPPGGKVWFTDLEKRVVLQTLDARVRVEGLPPALTELWSELRREMRLGSAAKDHAAKDEHV